MGTKAVLRGEAPAHTYRYVLKLHTQMELKSQVEKAFIAYDTVKILSAADLYESAIFRLLVLDLITLDWSQYVFDALMFLENPSAAYHFLIRDALGLAERFNMNPAANATNFVKFLNMCEGFYSADESAMRVLHCPDVERFDEERRRRFC
jgi:hypothetical protein